MALNKLNTSSIHTISVVKREVEPDSEGQSIAYEEASRRAGEKSTTLEQALEMHETNISRKRYYEDRLIGHKIVSSYVSEDGELKQYGTWIRDE
ncbi:MULTISPECIES: hypothetical protein [unclassified Rhodococcus (in: high G+C Gram-positive bacteria)]|uniref:hypothetical protein n=1 Tax=unclassified Rhodococcus (in: high G+C Gram-positive bacteria) TaxID=192944 RepID=UPI00117AFF05|nr:MULTISPECIES: hypothetical protein [unclassified Rhodococcus (in: high G+C Gram-positive bacteria)]